MSDLRNAPGRLMRLVDGSAVAIECNGEASGLQPQEPMEIWNFHFPDFTKAEFVGALVHGTRDSVLSFTLNSAYMKF